MGFEVQVKSENSVTERWDTLMKNYQEKSPEAGPEQWWMPLAPVFDFAAATSGAKREGDD